MKRSTIAVLLLSVLASLALAGCAGTGINLGDLRAIRGSGKSSTKSYDFKDFKRLDIGYAFKAEITRGDQYAVAVTVDDNVVNYLDVVQRGDTVRIALQPGSYTNTTFKATITMPDLVQLDLSGASQANIGGFKPKGEFKVTLSGASSVRGDAEAGSLYVVISGASRAELKGKAAALRVRGSGASSAQLEGFAVDTADIDLSGASKGTINAQKKLDVQLSGASNLTYLGKPEMGRSNISGASQMQSR